MNKQQTLQNIWAMTDQRVIDMMKKKTCTSSPTLSSNDSGDDDSDLESVDSRYGPFAAVPKEFRPPSSICSRTEPSQMSLNENKQMLSNRQPTAVPKTSPEKTVPKVPRLPNSKPRLCANSKPPLLPNPRPALLPNPRPTLLSDSRPPFLPKASPLLNPNPESMECKTVSNSNETSIFEQNINRSRHLENLKHIHHVANKDTVAQKNTSQKNNSGAKEKIPFQPPKKIVDNGSVQKPNKVLGMKAPKHENGKNAIKFEYVRKQEQKTVKINFKMPQASTLQEGEEMMKRANKNFHDAIEQDMIQGEYTISCQENTVKWVSSYENNNNTASKTGQVFGKNAHKILPQENIVKWDSSLNIDLSNNNAKGKIERDVSKMGHTINWHSSSNLNDSSSDSECKIEWTVIQEKKTTISAKKIEDKDHTQKQDRNNYLPTKLCTQNKSEKPRKDQRKTNFNRRMKQTTYYHRKKIPKQECKNPENRIYKNDLHQNNKIKCDRNEIRNFNTQNEYTVAAETFTQQCRISDQNLHSKVIPNFTTQNECTVAAETVTQQRRISDENKDSSKDIPNILSKRPEVTIKSDERKTIDNWESNSYPEKTDNITLAHTEKQKESMLNYGREIADLIIGSHAALSIFVSMFHEWKRSRIELISHFQHLEKNLKESSKKFTKYKDMLNIAKNGVTIAAAIPIPHVSVAARVISVLSSLFSVFLSSAEKKNSEIENACDMSIAATRDRSASTDLYMFGLQCGQNFEDTAKSIEEFHSSVLDIDKEIFDKDSPEIATFIRGVLEYRPRHRVFYKKLHRCFQELLQNYSSEFGKRFCEPFLLSSQETIDVVELLNWRFRHEDFNFESVQHELEQIEQLIQDNDTNIKQLTDRIHICVGILEDELKFLEGCVKDFNLFEKSMKF